MAGRLGARYKLWVDRSVYAWRGRLLYAVGKASLTIPRAVSCCAPYEPSARGAVEHAPSAGHSMLRAANCELVANAPAGLQSKVARMCAFFAGEFHDCGPIDRCRRWRSSWPAPLRPESAAARSTEPRSSAAASACVVEGLHAPTLNEPGGQEARARLDRRIHQGELVIERRRAGPVRPHPRTDLRQRQAHHAARTRYEAETQAQLGVRASRRPRRPSTRRARTFAAAGSARRQRARFRPRRS
jgi:hypothetical protein